MKLLLMLLIFSIGVNDSSQSAKIKITSDADLEICPDLWAGLVPHPIFCPFYYLCPGAHLRECPEGLYFNPGPESCDYPENVVDCDGGTRAPSTTTTSIASSTGPTTTISTTTAVETPETEVTVDIRSTTTGPTTSSSTTTRPTTTTHPGGLICPNDPSVFLPYPGDCSKFYLCQNGNYIETRNCPESLWFRYEIQSCQSPGSFCTE